jgi:hypothetical protein
MRDKAGDQVVGFWTVVLCIFAVLFLSNCLETIIGWFHSQDVKDWWPLSLLLGSALTFAYAVAYSAAMRVTSGVDIGFTIIYNTVLGSMLFLHGYLYYTIEIDWLAVNSHTATLTAVQKIIRSDFAPISICSIFLLGAIIAGRMRRVRRERESSVSKNAPNTSINTDAAQ